MQRVLVTGANGFVGNHLVKELSENNYEVIGVGGPQGSEQSPYISEYLVKDLTDQKATESIDFTKIDYVIHLAGMAAVGPSFDAPMQYITTNIGIEVNLFEAAITQKANPRFVIVSSGSLYDAGADLPLTENSPVIPSSPYAVSKIGQEQMGHYYNQRGFECIIARPFNHIGPGQGEGFIVPDLTKQVVSAEKGDTAELKVGNLEAQRDYTDVRDITRAYRLLVEKGKPGETYNICSGNARSGNDILSLILSQASVSPTVTEDPSKMRPSDNPVIYGDNSKIVKDTGWEPTINIEQTIADVVEDWRSR